MFSSVHADGVGSRTLEEELVVVDLGNGDVPDVELSGLGYEYMMYWYWDED